MARGFESKDVEFQQAEAERGKSSVPASSDEDRARQSSRRTLELALTSARAELAATTSRARRDTLGQAIADLMDQLSRSPDSPR